MIRFFAVVIVAFAALSFFLADDARTFAQGKNDQRCASFAAAGVDC